MSTDQLLELIDPDDRKRLRRSMAALLEGCREWHEEFRINRPDGQRRWLVGRGSLTHDLQGRPVRVVGVTYDLTQRKQAEEQLRELNEKLAHLLAQRTALAEERAAQLRLLAAELTEVEQRERNRAAQVLHDHLQPLLVAARLRLGLLDNQTPRADWPRILSETEELLIEAIDSTRSLSVELNPPVLSEEGLTPALQWLARWMETKHRLTVELSVDPAAEPVEETTRLLCFQAVRELLLNVVKHAGIHHASVRLEMAEPGLSRIEVSDQGLGFDPSTLRARSPDHRGFGLSSIEQRLSMIGGRLQIQSAIGKGTSIAIFVLSQPPQIQHGKPAPSSPLSASPRIRVLLADDHRILRECLAQVLRAQSDLEVVGEAEDGLAAIDLARQTHPNVLIMDVTMPRLDGIEATRRITQEMPEIRVIGLSNHDQTTKAHAMRQAGAVAYLVKTGPARLLLDTIRQSVLDQPPAPSQPSPRHRRNGHK